MRNTRVALLGFILASGLLAGCDINTGEGHGFSVDFASGKAQDTWTRSYTLASGGRIEVININGRIEAQPTSGNQVEVTGIRTARAVTDERAKELLGQVEIREEVGEGRVRLEVRAPRRSGMSQHDVTWTVKVPQGVNVDLKTTNGGVTLDGIKSAEVRAQTVNGGVRLELASPLPAEGRVDLDTVNGGVTLRLPETSRATINMRAVNGGVEVSDLDVAVQGERSRRRLEGTLNGGGAHVNLSTTNGGVKLGRSSTTPSS